MARRQRTNSRPAGASATARTGAAVRYLERSGIGRALRPHIAYRTGGCLARWPLGRVLEPRTRLACAVSTRSAAGRHRVEERGHDAAVGSCVRLVAPRKLVVPVAGT